MAAQPRPPRTHQGPKQEVGTDKATANGTAEAVLALLRAKSLSSSFLCSSVAS